MPVIVCWCTIYRMSDIGYSFWQGLLKLLADPAVLSSIGSILIAIGAMCSSKVKAKIVKWLDSIRKGIKDLHTPQQHLIGVDYCVTSMKIYEALNNIRTTLDCSRAAVLQFRNGTLFTLSAPMFRVYCSYEVLRPGVAPSCKEFSERIGTTILEFLGPLLSKQIKIAGVQEVEFCKLAETCCPRTHSNLNILKFETDEMPYCEFQCMLKASGIRVLYAVLLKSGNNPIGVLTLHYLVEHDADKLIKPHACKVCETAYTVQTQLDATNQTN